MFVNSANDLAVNNVVTMFTVVVRGRLLVPVLYKVFLMRGLSIVLRIECFGDKGGGKRLRHMFGHTPVRSRFHAALTRLSPGYDCLFVGPGDMFRRSGVAMHF